MEMIRVQNQNIELEGLLVEFSKRDQKVAKELNEKSETVARSEAEVAELKKKAIEEFKSSDDFQEAVVTLASNYFGEGFDFYKSQLTHHHPNLGIDVDNMDMDRDLLEKEEAEAEEKKNKGENGKMEKEQEKGEDKGIPTLSLLKYL